MIYFFILFFSICVHSMELEDFNDFSLPPRVSEIESFKESKLDRYLEYYTAQKKKGLHHWSGILKKEYEEEIENIGVPSTYMFDFWYIDELLNLEKHRRRILESFSLLDLLRAPLLLPENILNSIEFPSLSSTNQFQLKGSSSKKEGLFQKLINLDFEVKEYY